MNKLNLSILFVLGIFASSAAFASGGGMKISVVGAGSYGLNSVSGTEPISGATYEVKGALGYGGGLLFAFPMGATTDFEVGGVYSIYKIKTATTFLGATEEVTTDSPAVHIPAAVYFGLGRMVSLGLGGWYDVGMGDNSGTSNYGAQGGLRFRLSQSVFFDGAYNYGLKDVNGQKSSGVMALLGFTLGK